MTSTDPPRPTRRRPLWLLALLALFGFALLAVVRSRRQVAREPRLERALYVWDATIAGDDLESGELVAFALDKGIGTLFVDAGPVGYAQPGAVDDYRELVELAHAGGVRVLALGGSPWWGVADDAGLPGQPTGHAEGWSFYAEIARSGVPFDGIVDDTEPYQADTPDWWNRPAERAQDYLDFLTGVRARIGALPLYATIPFWYDEDARMLQALSEPLNVQVARLVDVVAVMSYRDEARGADGIVFHARGEVAAGPCLLGVETTDLGPGPTANKQTFWEEGEGRMDAELRRATRALRNERHLRGWFVHDYASYRALAP